MALIGADLDAPDQIALRDDADQIRTYIDDRESADAVADHRIGRDLNGDVGTNGANSRSHHVPRLHGRLPCSGGHNLTGGRKETFELRQSSVAKWAGLTARIRTGEGTSPVSGRPTRIAAIYRIPRNADRLRGRLRLESSISPAKRTRNLQFEQKVTAPVLQSGRGRILQKAQFQSRMTEKCSICLRISYDHLANSKAESAYRGPYRRET